MDHEAFVFSVPFDVGEREARITATHAIIVGGDGHRTPAAVAGMQIDYSIFRNIFFNETNKVKYAMC